MNAEEPVEANFALRSSSGEPNPPVAETGEQQIDLFESRTVEIGQIYWDYEKVATY